MSEIIHGDGNGNKLNVNANKTQVYGLAGNDILTSDDKSDVLLIGGSGDDSLIVDGGNATLAGGTGTDTFELNYSADKKLSVVIQDIDPATEKVIVNFDGNVVPQLTREVDGNDVVLSDGDRFNLTLKGVRENDYFDGEASEQIWQVLQLTNNLRESQNLSALTLSEGLMDGAAIRTAEIIELDKRGELDIYKHTRPDGSDFSTALTKDYNGTGENIGTGESTPADAMTEWIGSTSHYKNLVDPAYLKLGVGYEETTTRQRYYWEQLFAGSLSVAETVSTDDLSATNVEVNAVEKFSLGSNNADTFNNTVNAATISALGGDDTITNSAVLVSISGGADNDSIINSGAFTTINAGTGNDTVSLLGDAQNIVIFSAGDGNDTVIGFDGNDSLKILGDEDFTPVTVGNNVVVSVGAYSVTFVNAANVDLNIDGTRSKLFVGTDNAETINNTVDGATVQALAGDDSITSDADATITAGTGNDTVSLSSDAENLLIYTLGDGNDSILGFDDDDTLKIDGDEFTPVSIGGDVVIAVGDDSIRIRGANNLSSLNVEGTRSKLFIGTERSDTFDNTVSGATIRALAGNDFVTSNANATVDAGTGRDTVSLTGGQNLLLYNAGDGNDSIFGFDANDTFSIAGGEYTPDTVGNDVVLAVGDDSIRIRDAANVSLNIIGTQSADTSKPITLTKGNDYYYNPRENVTILALGGNDTIANIGLNDLIDGGAGDDQISLSSTAQNNLIKYRAGDGNDTIIGFDEDDTLRIFGTYSSATVGSDVVLSVGTGSISLVGAANLSTVNIDNNTNYIKLTEGDDNYSIEADGVTVAALGGNDTIQNDYYDSSAGEYVGRSNVSIDGGAGDDSIINRGDNVSIDGGSGNDRIIKWSDSNVIIDGDAGDDSIYNYSGDSVTIDGGADNDDIWNYSDSVTIEGGTGNDSIYNDSRYHGLPAVSNVTIDGGAGDDSIYSSGINSTLIGGAGSDSIWNYGDSVTIDGGADNDDIWNYSDSVTIDGGADNDCIFNYLGSNISISGGAGNDSIYNQGYLFINTGLVSEGYSDSVTINGGAGDDQISLDSIYAPSQARNTLIEYRAGDGNDTVYGFNEDDTLKIYGEYSSVTVGNDLILSVGDDSISLVGAATLSTVNIIGTESVAPVASSFVSLTNGNDNYSNSVDAVTIAALGGNDSVWNDGAQVSVGGGRDNDTLTNYGNSVTLSGDAGNDNIFNSNLSTGVLITGGDGADNVDNHGTNTTVDTGNGNDSVYNDANSVTVNTGDGSDWIFNSGSLVSIDAGAGNDDVSNLAANVTINTGEGNDLVNTGGTNTSIDAGSGDDNVINTGANSTILGGLGSDSISNDSDAVFVSGGDGSDLILNNGGTNATLDAGNDNDFVYNNAARSSIDAGDGSDRIDNSANNVSITAGAGNDTVNNEGFQVSINAGDDDDYVFNLGTNSTVFGGAGVDTIRNNAANVTLAGGRDNDRISLGSSAGDNIIQYTVGDGNDVIFGYSANTTLNFLDIAENAFTSVVSGNDVILNFDAGGSIRLVDSRDKPINIKYGASNSAGGGSGNDGGNGGGSSSGGDGGGGNSGGGSGSESAGGTSASDNDSHSASGRGDSSGGRSREGGGGSVRTATSTRPGYTNVTPTSAPTYPTTTSTATTPSALNTYIYTGGNEVISTYKQGEKIIFGEVYTGAFYDEAGNLIVGSSTGALAVTNAVGKVVDLVDAWGNDFVKTYSAPTAGVVDGRGIAGFEVISGSTGSDIIQAGDGGSQLWGGNTTETDTLLGGNGIDVFVGGKTYGSDSILNAAANDLINFNDATLADIVDTAELNGTIAIAFNTGNVITIQSTNDLSAALTFADGNALRYNHVTKSWQTA